MIAAAGDRLSGNQRLSRNAVFREIVLDILSGGSEMYLRDICPIVQDRVPEWCWGNWKKGVHQVLIGLLEKDVLRHEVVHRGPRSFRYRLRSPGDRGGPTRGAWVSPTLM